MSIFYTNRFLIFLLIGLSIGCNNFGESGKQSNKIIPKYDDAYFKYSKLLKYAKIDENTDVVCILNPWEKNDTLQKFIITNSSDLINGDYDVIHTPVQKATVLSSVYVGYIDMLNSASSINAVDNALSLCSPRINKLIANKSIVGLSEVNSVKIEKIHQLKSDLIIFSQFNKADYPLKVKATKLGISSLACVEFLEQNPLARAEWIKLFGLLLDKEDEAIAMFNMVEEHYLELSEWAIKFKNKPTVFTGSFFSNNWHVSGGKSNQAILIKDAGGLYLWDSLSNIGSIPMSFEDVYSDAKSSDIWINCGNYFTKNDLLQSQKRYSLYSAFKNNQVWNYHKKVSPNKTGFAYWEMGVSRPDLVLKDLIKIFHPKKMKDHTFVFYKNIDK